jgi:hypothetical protein
MSGIEQNLIQHLRVRPLLFAWIASSTQLQLNSSNLRYKSGRLLATVRIRHYGRGDVRRMSRKSKRVLHITIIKFRTSNFYHIKKITLNHALLKLSHERWNCCEYDTGLKYNFFNIRVHLGIYCIFFIN